MKVAASWDKTLSCSECGSWEAEWRSPFAGHEGAETGRLGDVQMDCPNCGKYVLEIVNRFNEGMGGLDFTRISPDEIGWRKRDVWYHCGSADWWEKCPGDVRVHLGRRETSMWLHRLEKREAMYTVRVNMDGLGFGPIGDLEDAWGRLDGETAYVNSYEFPGSVSLYVKKNRLELVDVEYLE